MIYFEVLGPVKGKQRPKISTFNGIARAYTPKDTINYENLVKVAYQVNNKESYLDKSVPLSCTIAIYQTPPSSTSKKRRNLMLNGQLKPIKKPDIDNVVKVILDALNKVAFYDDTQIVELRVHKAYGEEDKVCVCIEEVS